MLNKIYMLFELCRYIPCLDHTLGHLLCYAYLGSSKESTLVKLEDPTEKNLKLSYHRGRLGHCEVLH